METHLTAIAHIAHKINVQWHIYTQHMHMLNTV
jgi:hypothetical protein